MVNNIFTYEYLKACFDLNEDSGELIWKTRPLCHFKNAHGMNSFNSRYAEKVAGFVSKNQHGKPYIKVTICGRYFYAHRIIGLLCGFLDENMEIDHINGNGLDNRPCNLRSVDRIENCRNRRKNSNNKSGVTGVHFDSQSSKWKASISICGTKKTIGLFKSKEQAIEERLRYEKKYNFHKNHGSCREL